MIGKAVRFGFPAGRLGMGWWAWKHRHELTGWAGFAAGAPIRALDTSRRADLVIEARLRGRLTADSRTRGLDGLHVYVEEGIAVLQGTVPMDAHDAALEIATNTTGVRRVRDELTDTRRWRRPKAR